MIRRPEINARPLELVPGVCRRLTEFADRHNDAQPFIGAAVIALASCALWLWLGRRQAE
jgi:hypothetical protein